MARYKKAIIELLGKMENEEALKRIYKLTEYLYLRESTEGGLNNDSGRIQKEC